MLYVIIFDITYWNRTFFGGPYTAEKCGAAQIWGKKFSSRPPAQQQQQQETLEIFITVSYKKGLCVNFFFIMLKNLTICPFLECVLTIIEDLSSKLFYYLFYIYLFPPFF